MASEKVKHRFVEPRKYALYLAAFFIVSGILHLMMGETSDAMGSFGIVIGIAFGRLLP